MSQTSHDFSHSFTDLMTSLAVIFILLLVATLNDAFSEGAQAVTDLREAVVKELTELKLNLTPDPEDPYTQIINLAEDKVKFQYDKANLSSEGKDLIGQLFNVLAPALCEDKLREKLESVIVEGHTDLQGNNSIKGKLHNVDLSQKRAFAVLDHAFNVLDKTHKKELECLRKIAISVGRGSSKPKQDDDSSRRVEVKIRVKSGFRGRA